MKLRVLDAAVATKRCVRRQMRVGCLAAVCAVVIGLAAGDVRAGRVDLQTVVKNLQAASQRLSGLQATVTHQRVNTQLGVQEPRQVGTLRFSTRGNVRRLRIDYTEPQSKTVVVNGDEAVLIEPALNQAFVSTTSEIAKKTASTGLLTVLTDAQRFSENFEAALDGEETLDGQATTKLVLRPKGKSQYTRLEVWVSHRNWLPVKQILHTRSDYTTIVLTNIRLQAVPDASFKVDYKKYKIVRG
ncbi:MAG: outer-membrane lipoprotein carrier protein LolA [Chloracidobacterium sp.]|nr:outer-membrane lipoprotein carrier protein LolA [Chloracidobacterium sp.]MDW8217076.1 outer-membrane lipoprotein carrier protein LolA [Acidobacteriota bacterium]